MYVDMFTRYLSLNCHLVNQCMCPLVIGCGCLTDCLKEVFTGKKGEEEDTEKAGKPVKKKKKKKAPKKG